MNRSAILREPIDVAKLIASATVPEAGALSVFVGTVRNRNEGRPVVGIEYSAYEAMAEKEFERITTDASEHFDINVLVVEHRIGTLSIGDASVVVVTSAEHRAAAMECTRFVIDQIKKRVPIWKLEHYADGSREWVDPTATISTVPT
ncbi:MAG TPA: molybdenum cofactor biosynthesis protein MoaE [Gemmatimonadaceae bacterium]|jgi:molybdopterin synthase catalytic subunit